MLYKYKAEFVLMPDGLFSNCCLFCTVNIVFTENDAANVLEGMKMHHLL